MRVLDLSWNSLGTHRGKMFARKLAELLAGQTGLMHLDISFNKLQLPECQTIAAALTNNHSLWGLHVQGNAAHLDAKGFMQLGSMGLAAAGVASEHITQRINGTRMVVPNPEIGDVKMKQTTNCWICEGWNELLLEAPSGTLSLQANRHPFEPAGLSAPRVRWLRTLSHGYRGRI